MRASSGTRPSDHVLRQLHDARILRRIETGDAVHDRPVMRGGVQHHLVLGVVIDRQLDDRVRLRAFRQRSIGRSLARRHVPADRIAQLDQKRDGDDRAGPFRAARDERDGDGDEDRQSDMRDERPSRGNADGAKSGDVVEEESIERRPQAERADEAEEDPGPGEGERLPFARGEGDERETERERAGEKPALRIGRGVVARGIGTPREVVEQPVARHRGEAHRLVPRPLHSVQLRRGVIRIEERRDEEQRDPAGDRDPPQRRPEDGDRHHDRDRSEEKEVDVRQPVPQQRGAETDRVAPVRLARVPNQREQKDRQRSRPDVLHVRRVRESKRQEGVEDAGGDSSPETRR